ncbi:hypothetical protein [Paracoccus aestuariivivens]|uniref:Uncharacterized protein n=1 Tax=Paracoccus aestuariivivens TaxID=1820333 RepID=A0A6L6J404_9RHOB|nr:hypothetical protein [Paracoccus aestuariivivens]MTH76296.1 hypothetical protein [Paracoccus aestuariivivens]
MYRFSFFVALISYSTAINAQQIELRLHGCQTKSDKTYFCQLSNLGPIAIPAIEYNVTLAEDGRTFPWAEHRSGQEIAGGLEPGETMDLAIQLPTLPLRANEENVSISVELLPQYLPPPRPPADAPATAKTFANQVEACFNRSTLSSAAANGAIDVNVTGLKIQKVKNYVTDDAAAEQLFQAARRAILVCMSRNGTADVDVSLRFDGSGVHGLPSDY